MDFHQKNLILYNTKHTSLLRISVILLVLIINTSDYILASPTKFTISQTLHQQQVTANNINTGEVTELQLGKAIERELKGDEACSYIIKLEANQYLQAVVEQKGIDIVATLYSPNGEKVYEVDSPNGTKGSEPIYFISQVAGSYRLEVRSLDKEAKAGNYEVKINELRASVAEDIDRADGFRALGQAVLLETEGKKESLKLAIKKYQEAIEKFNKAQEPLTKATAMNGLGGIYNNSGNYDKAEPLYIQALEIRKQILGDNDHSTATSINSLAGLYYRKGDYVKAEPLLIQALEINRKTLGDNDPSTATSMNNLAELYRNKGDYSKAEPLLIQALEINRKTLGDNDPLTANSMNNLAELYRNKGDYSKAEPLFIQALEIAHKTLGDNHPFTATSINNLVGFYSNKGDYVKAEPLLIQVSEIYRKTLGNNHPLTANSLNNLAALYSNKGDYLKAESLFIQALEIYRKIFGDNHPSTATSLNNLAEIYSNKEDYSKAEPLYIQTLEIRKKILGNNHPDTTISINNLANLYSSKRDYEKAVKYKKDANDAREEELSTNLSIGSEHSKQIYLQKYAYETDITLSLHVQLAPTNLLAIKSALTQILRRKGRSIDAANQSIEALRKRSSSEDIVLLDELTAKKTLLSNLTIQGLGKLKPEEYQAKLKSLQDEIDKLEFQISQRSAEFRTQTQPITLETVQQAIPKDSTLVEFASYRPYDPKTKKYGAPRYVVYLLNNEGNPDWVDLGLEEPIDKLVDDLREKLHNEKTSINEEIKPLARKLDEMVMQPVRKLTGKDKRFLVAPDGKLNLLPFAALVDENGKFLVENNKLSYLTSGRDLLRLQIKIESKSAPLIIGNPDFGTIDSDGSRKEGTSIFASINFPPLPATEEEAKKIKELFPTAELLLQKQATEKALSKATAPSIIHIATHGFFLKEEIPSQSETTRKGEITGTQTPNIKVENPLIRSGLVLAGANVHQEEKEDQGIFTAFKATALNLWGTKLVVLSACDTGVGEVKTGDGIYGLRRALVLAGSETQLMSLWPISDNGTKELMIDYYIRLQKGESRAEALRQVQISLLKSNNHQHPYYWASFIQSGEWANLAGKR